MFRPVEKDWATLNKGLITKPKRMRVALVWGMLGEKASRKKKKKDQEKAKLGDLEQG